LQVYLTLPQNTYLLTGRVLRKNNRPRRRGGGNAEIGFFDFQGLWEERKTAPPFSGLSINRHFHGLILS
jgi:hypothetical protein